MVIKNYTLLIKLIRGQRYYGREIARLTGYSAEYVRQVALKINTELPKKGKPKVEITCKSCGVKKTIPNFIRTWTRYYREGYCSKTCYNKENLFDEIPCACGCGQIIKIRKYRQRYKARKYFSRDCFRKVWIAKSKTT